MTKQSRPPLFLITLILLIAAAVRIWHLSTNPPGLQHDEVFHAHDAFTLREGHLSLWFTSNAGNEPLYIYLMAVTTAAIGDNVLGIRFASLIAGMLALAFTYRWAERAFGRRAALIAIAFMAISFWPVWMSRVGLRAVTLPPMAALTAWLFVRAMEKKSHRAFLWAGLAMGFTLYTYPAAFAIPLIFLAFMIYLALFRRDLLIGTWRGQVIFWLAAALIYAPLAWSILAAGGYLRVQQTAAPIAALQAGDTGPLLDSTWKSLSLWTTNGDPQWRYNIADQPVFGKALAVMFAIGAWGALLIGVGSLPPLPDWTHQASTAPGLTKRRRAYAALVVLFLLIGIIPSAVTDSPPAFLRATATLPATFIALALGFELAIWFARTLAMRFHAAFRYAPAILIAALLVLTTFTTLRDYFFIWPNNAEVQRVYRSDLAAIAAYLRTHHAPGGVAISTTEPHHLDRFIYDYTPHGSAEVQWFDGLNGLLIPGGGEPAWIFVTREPPIRDTLQADILDHLPLLKQQFFNSDSMAFTLYEAPPGDAFFDQFAPPIDQDVWVSDVLAFPPDDPDGVRTSVDLPVQFGDVVQLVGYSSVSEAAPDNWMPVALYFRVLRDVTSPEPWQLFVHVLDADGNLVAGRDFLSVPASTWRAGDVFIQLHDVALPALAPGRYHVEIGFYSQADNVRFPVIVDGERVGERLLLEAVKVITR